MFYLIMAAASKGPFGFSGTEIASLLVAAVAALSAFASQRSASRASVANVSNTTRADIEKEAYTRAEGFLDGTISRQDSEITQLRTEVDDLRLKFNASQKAHDEEIRLHRVTQAELDDCRTDNRTMARQIERLTSEVADLRVQRPQI